MIISSINNVSNVKNYRQIKNSKQQNQIRNENEQKQNRNLLDYPKNYRPSFGIIEEIAVAVAYEIFVLCTVGGIGYYSTKKEEKAREAEEQKLKEERNKEVKEISNKYHVSQKEAEKIHDEFFKIAFIKPNGDGNEIGLNAVIGNATEKYKLAVDFITPLVAKEKKLNIGGRVPNGLIMYGPPGTGKTYMAQKACEHLEHFGVNVVNIKLSPRDHEKNAGIITDAFEQGKARYKETGKYTVINFTQDIDNIFTKRSISTKNIPEISAFLSCADDCAKEGVTWIGTANIPQQLDSAVLRAGRTDIKIPVSRIQDYAISDMLKFSLLQNGQEAFIDEIDYEKIVETMQNDSLYFSPSEINKIVELALNHKMHPDMPLTEKMLIKEMHDFNKDGLSTMRPDEMADLKKKKDYVDSY